MGLGPDARLAGDKPRRYVFFSCFRTNDTVGGRINGARRIEQHTRACREPSISHRLALKYIWAMGGDVEPLWSTGKKGGGSGKESNPPRDAKAPPQRF